MFSVSEFFEESKKSIQSENIASQTNYAQVAISKKFIDILTFIITSPYFVGKKHGTTGMLDMRDDEFTAGDEYANHCRGSIMGDSEKFFWTFSSMQGKLTQDATATNRDVVTAIQKQY